jgi:hypothetical protein
MNATSKATIKLICKSVWFYSNIDEDLFFEWIKKIPSIIRCDGRGDELYLYVNNAHISDDDLRELLALFYRYKIDMRQLQVFLQPNNKEWFYGSPKGYWHRRVFGLKI